jgi:hypothetical protein
VLCNRICSPFSERAWDHSYHRVVLKCRLDRSTTSSRALCGLLHHKQAGLQTRTEIGPQNYWVSGLCPSSGMLNNVELQRFGNRVCFLLQVREGGTYSVGCLVTANLNHWTRDQQSSCLPLSPEEGNGSSFRNVVFSSIRDSGRGTKSRNPVSLSVTTIVKTHYILELGPLRDIKQNYFTDGKHSVVQKCDIFCDRYKLIVIYQLLLYFMNLINYWPPLWSSGQSSWLQIRRPGFDSRHYQKKK